MFAALYRYLIINHQLSLPGVRRFVLERTSAQSDFVNKQIQAPAYSISLQQDTLPHSGSFFKWLGGALAISEREAIIKFNDFIFDIKKQISDGAIVKWDHVGELKKGMGGKINFTADNIETPETSIIAEKIIREHASHTIRVGAEEKSSVEMQELLQSPAGSKSRWWILPLILFVITVAFIVWYMITNGFSPGNTIPLASIFPNAPFLAL